MTSPQQLTVKDGEEGARLDVWLATQLDGFSRSRIQKLIEAGHVLVNGQTKMVRYSVRPLDEISVVIPPPEAAWPVGENIPLEIVFEDDDLMVLNKPPGLTVHPGAGVKSGTLVNALLGRPGSVSSIGGVERPGIVHRLDKDTSGLIIVAKSDRAHNALSGMLARREVKRLYWALVYRPLRQLSGTVDAPVGRHATIRTKMSVQRSSQGRAARTHYRVAEQFGPVSLLECRLETGRTHQIRVHLSHIGHPVVGDSVYGGAWSLGQQLIHNKPALRLLMKSINRQMLHAKRLEFKHPVSGEILRFDADLPSDFADLLTCLRQETQSQNKSK